SCPRLRHGRDQPGQDHRRTCSLRWLETIRPWSRGLPPRPRGLQRTQVSLHRHRRLSGRNIKEIPMLDRTNELTAWDRDHFFHPSTHMGSHARGETSTRVISTGNGVYITDRDGRTSLDAFAGLYCVNVGYGRTEIAEAIAEQAKDLAYYHAYVGHGSEASITLSKMIIDRAPEGMSRVYFGLSG